MGIGLKLSSQDDLQPALPNPLQALCKRVPQSPLQRSSLQPRQQHQTQIRRRPFLGNHGLEYSLGDPNGSDERRPTEPHRNHKRHRVLCSLLASLHRGYHIRKHSPLPKPAPFHPENVFPHQLLPVDRLRRDKRHRHFGLARLAR